MPKYRLVLSVQADHDLDALYEDGYRNWGEAQADKYFGDIVKHFDDLCENPYLFRAVDEIRVGYRRSVCGEHSIFYRIIDRTVEIMALVKYENWP